MSAASLARARSGFHVSTPHPNQHEPASNATGSSLLLRSRGLLVPGITLNMGLKQVGAGLEQLASRFIHSLGLSPEANSEAIEAMFGDYYDRLQEFKAAAADVDRNLRIWAQDLLESREQRRGVRLDALHCGKFENIKILDAKCKSLISGARSNENQKNQLSAIKQILFLTTRYPGLRRVFVNHLNVEDDSPSNDKIMLLWKSRTNTDSNINQDEWLFYLHKSVHCLLPPNGCCTYLSAIEQSPPSNLGFVDLANCQQRTVIEQLISVCEDSHGVDDRCIAIRYLAGILELNPFWLSVCRRANHAIVRKLLSCAVTILKDEGIDDFPIESTESTPMQHVSDRDGIDTLMIAILFGILAWNPEHSQTDDYRFLWLEAHCRLIELIRSVQAATVVPRAHWLVLYCDNEGLDLTFHRLSQTTILADGEVLTMTGPNHRAIPMRMYPSDSHSKRKALLIAPTYRHVYINDPNMLPLKYSHKDPVNLRNLLLEHGYKEEDITILVDIGARKETYPTRVNIIKHIRKLVLGAQAGDSFFIHFSGHGGQRVADEDQFEVDGTDELLYPCDYHELRQEGKEYYIFDNLLRELLVDPLPEGCKLVALIDCCSSGTMLDLPINDDSEGDRGSVVSATGAEEFLIGGSSMNKKRVSQGQTLQADEPSDLIVGSTITQEPAEECLPTYCRIDKPILLSVQGRKSRTLQPEPPPSAHGRGERRLTSSQSSVTQLSSAAEKARVRQAGRQRSQTLPIYLYALRFQNRGPVHLLPLTNSRSTKAIREEPTKNALLDTRIINADVMCIASCRDGGQSYETYRGGALVQAFCAVVGAARRDHLDLTLKDLKFALRRYLENIHKTDMENMMKIDPNFDAAEYDTPIPQFSFSHKYDCHSKFTIS